MQQNSLFNYGVPTGQSILLSQQPWQFCGSGWGVLGCRGFHSSFRATHGGLSLNIDVSTMMIIKPGPVMEFLMENQGVRNCAGIDWGKAKRTLKNLRITARPGNAEHKITGLSEIPSNKQIELPPQVRNPPVSQDHDSMKFLDETESDCSNLEEEGSLRNKKRKVDYPKFLLSPGFLAPLSQALCLILRLLLVHLYQKPPCFLVSIVLRLPLLLLIAAISFGRQVTYEAPPSSSCSSSSGMDHTTIHPKFLQTNATSHTRALGAFAELLDNSVDEI